MAKTMTARYHGRCRACHGEILPGDIINYGGRGNVRHGGPDGCDRDNGAPETYSNINPATGGRMSDRARVHVARFSSGAVMTVNSRGRCEDAPCCGCCT
jgi:hypothetical protein